MTDKPEDVISIKAILVGTRSDRDGAWKITLEVQASDGPKVAALALQQQTVFNVDFRIEASG